MRLVVRSALNSISHSPANRLRARELAWGWVGAKWPKLLPHASEVARGTVSRSAPGQELIASTSADGLIWTLSVAHEERHGRRTWMTRAHVIDAGSHDGVGLETACTDVPDAPLVVAPPRLLADWVEGLQLEDAGLAVQGTARDVTDKWQLDALFHHLLSDARTLPIIALVNRPQSHYYGVDPDGLAENLRGLAHVACIASHLSQQVNARLGPDFSVLHGAARIFAPGFIPNSDPNTETGAAARNAHPLVKDATPTGNANPQDAGAFRKLLRRKICAMSVSSNPELDV